MQTVGSMMYFICTRRFLNDNDWLCGSPSPQPPHLAAPDSTVSFTWQRNSETKHWNFVMLPTHAELFHPTLGFKHCSCSIVNHWSRLTPASNLLSLLWVAVTFCHFEVLICIELRCYIHCLVFTIDTTLKLLEGYSIWVVHTFHCLTKILDYTQNA